MDSFSTHTPVQIKVFDIRAYREFAYSKNVMERPVDFYKETFDASGFDKIMVPGHIELAGYDKIRYINTMYPWEGKEYHRGAYSMEATGAEKGMGRGRSAH